MIHLRARMKVLGRARSAAHRKAAVAVKIPGDPAGDFFAGATTGVRPTGRLLLSYEISSMCAVKLAR